MKITIERKYKKKGYTIGNLYIDSNKPLCNTLEPVDRNLAMDMSKTDQLAEFRRVALQATAEKGAHPYGTTAIPTGCYPVTMSPSSKFKALRPFLTKVPGFAGIMIHEGKQRIIGPVCQNGSHGSNRHIINNKHHSCKNRKCKETIGYDAVDFI